jgi:predicted O-linked N-acetylglucosamine transferase (SPINDLY family)
MTLKFLGLWLRKPSEKSKSKRVAKILAQAYSLQSEGRFADAGVAYQSVLDIDPHHREALTVVAGMAAQSGQLERAAQLYAILIASEPENAETYYKRGNALHGLGQWDAALADYDRAVLLDLKHAKAFCNRGAVLEKLGRLDDALGSYDRAIDLNPEDALTFYNRGSVLKAQNRLDEALVSYERAIAHRPNYPEAYINRGHVLNQLQRPKDAVLSYDAAIGLNPMFAEAFHGRGMSLASCRQYDAALSSYDEAIALNPSLAEAFKGRGVALASLNRFEEAVSSYDQATALNASQKFLPGLRRHARMQTCDWDGLAADLERLTAGVTAREPVCPPFYLLSLVDSARLSRLAAETWVREECPLDDALGALVPRPAGDRIRVGYFSADFRNHAVSFLTAELFELHDRSKFEIVAFAFGREASDPMRARLERAFDRFFDVRNQSDAQVASLAREIGIDIAVDLGGYTEDCRTRIFALRAAPVQVSYIGYLGTLAAPYMDYLVADRTIIPEGTELHYAEKIIYLPSYQVNDSQRRISDRTFSRDELGLPRDGFVFCCFNANYKMLPATVEIWMRILRRVEGSNLFLNADNQGARQNLLKHAERCGVDARRIVFGQRIPVEHYLARFRVMDLFLDTLPYNAGTTASDALWSGLPVLTCAGEAFAGRVAASVLAAVGLPELITESPFHYEELAVKLATNASLLASIREKLTRNRTVAPLFDTPRFTKNLEFAYARVYAGYRAGAPTEHILVADQS